MTTIPESVVVIGAGSWGTALAILLARNGMQTWLWGRNAKQLSAMQQNRCNDTYLPGIRFPDNLKINSSLREVLPLAQHVLIVTPSSAFRATLREIRSHISIDTGILWATKGLEPDTGKLLHQLVEEEIGVEQKTAVLSGPTFAKEVAQGLPTAITVASFDATFSETVATMLHNETFRAYTSTDVIGVEVGGTVKNVLAIAAGIADGLNLGANTRAALITRGLVEVQRLGTQLGGQAETFMGLAGLGDLVLTCTDDQSRNRRVGKSLASGSSVSDILSSLGQVAEGVYAAQEVKLLADRVGVEMPIVEEVYRVIYQKKSPQQAVQDLFSRQIKPEYSHSII